MVVECEDMRSTVLITELTVTSEFLLKKARELSAADVHFRTPFFKLGLRVVHLVSLPLAMCSRFPRSFK